MYNSRGGSSQKLAEMLSPERSAGNGDPNGMPKLNRPNHKTLNATGQNSNNEPTTDASGNKYYFKESSGNIDIVSGQNIAKEAIDLPAQKFLLIDTEKKQVHGYGSLLDLFQGYFFGLLKN
jgi:hypothetical protein